MRLLILLAVLGLAVAAACATVPPGKWAQGTWGSIAWEEGDGGR